VRQKVSTASGTVNIKLADLIMPRADSATSYLGAGTFKIHVYKDQELLNSLSVTLPTLTSKKHAYTITATVTDANTPLIPVGGRALLKFTLTPESNQATLYDSIKLLASGVTFYRCWGIIAAPLTQYFDCGIDTNAVVLTKTIVASAAAIEVYTVAEVSASSTNVKISGFINSAEQWISTADVPVTVSGFDSTSSKLITRYTFYEYWAPGNYFLKQNKITLNGGNYPIRFPFVPTFAYTSAGTIEILIKTNEFAPVASYPCIAYIYEERVNSQSQGHDFVDFARCAYDSTAQKYTLNMPLKTTALSVNTKLLYHITTFPPGAAPGIIFPAIASKAVKKELLFSAKESSTEKQKDFYNFFAWDSINLAIYNFIFIKIFIFF
jgi:hypothetical protein